MNSQNINSFEIAKEFYEKLDPSQIANLTKERWEEISLFANAYVILNISNNYNHYYSLEEIFSIILQKIISSKNNILLLTRQNSTRYNSNATTASIELINDGEKLLFIQKAFDPENNILNHWLNIKTELTVDYTISASNFLKAKKIMQSYYGGFFILKLFNNAEVLQKQFEKLNRSNTKSK